MRTCAVSFQSGPTPSVAGGGAALALPCHCTGLEDGKGRPSQHTFKQALSIVVVQGLAP